MESERRGLSCTWSVAFPIICAALTSASAFSADFSSKVREAEKILNHDSQFQGILEDDTSFIPLHTVGDEKSLTVKFKQTYKGVDVFGRKAMVHFNADGKVHDVEGGALRAVLDVNPTVTLEQARQILDDRYQTSVELTEAPQLRVFRNFEGVPHLVYRFLTKTTATHFGKDVLVDAHSGAIVLETDRAYDAVDVKSTVYSADTEEAHKHIYPENGAPDAIDMSWYVKALEDGSVVGQSDRSAENADRNATKVYNYYRDTFNRLSFDDKDTRLVSVVHMGLNMNNAFWTNEYRLMAYGDGDGKDLIDLTNGLDVAAHELTHGVTANTAGLIYAAESGALNESFSDFFGKMVDYNEGDWDIGAKVVAPGTKIRAIRNMKNPEEFGQPGTNDSPLKKPVTGPCTRKNDRCGVHRNSGIPNHAAVLIVEAIGKHKAEKLYYNVLTRRLSEDSNFHDMREQAEKMCDQMYEMAPADCKAVQAAFDEVKM